VWIALSSGRVSSFISQAVGRSTKWLEWFTLPAVPTVFSILHLGRMTLQRDAGVGVDDGSTWKGPKASTRYSDWCYRGQSTAFGAGVSVGFPVKRLRTLLFVTHGMHLYALNDRPCDSPGCVSTGHALRASFITTRHSTMPIQPAVSSVRHRPHSATRDSFDGYDDTLSTAMTSFCANTFCLITKSRPNLQP